MMPGSCFLFRTLPILLLVFSDCRATVAADLEVPETILVPAGPVIIGSDRAEREFAYRLDEAAYGHSRTREWLWYENEPRRQRKATRSFRITRTPITNAQYAAFVEATGHPVPDVNVADWRSLRS